MELLEVAEVSSVKQISITQDFRSHCRLSLLHPCLALAQGPALILYFHEISLEVEDVVRLTSPSRYYSSTVSGEGGCGGKDFPRFGRDFCASFALTNCLQVLSGKSFMVFDPNGEYFIENLSQPKIVNNVADQPVDGEKDLHSGDLSTKSDLNASSGNKKAGNKVNISDLKSPELRTTPRGKAAA